MSARRAAEKFLRRTPGETVVAAGVFQASGGSAGQLTSAAVLGAGGALLARRHSKQTLAESGFALKGYPLVAVTESRVHLFDASSGMSGRWVVRREVAVWDRASLRVGGEVKAATNRLIIEAPDGRRLALEAMRSRAPAREVIEALAGAGWQTRPPPPDIRPAKPHVTAAAARAGGVLAAAAAVVALSSLLPFAVAQGPGGSVGLDGMQLSGVAYLVVGGFGMLRGITLMLGVELGTALNRGVAPLLTGIVGGIIAITDWSEIQDAVRTIPAKLPGVTVSVAPGYWVMVAGVVTALVAGTILMANRPRRVIPPAPAAPMPPPPAPQPAG